MAGRRLKSFAELWRDASFEARREDHIARLDAAIADNTAPTDPELQPLLDQYERTPDTKRRYEVAKMIERACRQPTSKAKKTSLEAMMLSVFGPDKMEGESADAFRLRQIRWAIWAMNHGIWWRAQRKVLNALDREELADLALGQGDLEDELEQCWSREREGWNAGGLSRMERELLAVFDLTIAHPDPPYLGEIAGEVSPEPCECCEELLEQYEADGTISDLLAR